MIVPGKSIGNYFQILFLFFKFYFSNKKNAEKTWNANNNRKFFYNKINRVTVTLFYLNSIFNVCCILTSFFSHLSSYSLPFAIYPYSHSLLYQKEMGLPWVCIEHGTSSWGTFCTNMKSSWKGQSGRALKHKEYW